MIDIANIEKYRENNRIEAKKALGGLPKSIWETYSSFANTLGGVILLGVEEHADKSLHPLNLPDPEALVKEFWEIVNNPQRASVNILTDKNVSIEEVDGKRIIVITVPRAQRYDKPVYIDANPLTGTYRRDGEGDYRCAREEVQAMLRDAAVRTQDMTVLEHMRFDVFDFDSIRRYRSRMKSCRPMHVWEKLEDDAFLYKLGAAGRGSDGKMHPTAAGLLMFGYEYEIVKEYPDYFLDYQEQPDADGVWTNRIVSSSGDWSGNIFDFYFRVYDRIIQNLRDSFEMEDGVRMEDTPIHRALCEAIANCLINADYYGTCGLVIIRTQNEIRISNPGGFRIAPETAKAGGISDPRNATLMKMFNLIDIGRRAGSGIPNIYAAWKNQSWNEPEIVESFEPERITVILSTKKADDKKTAVKIDDKMPAIKALNKQLIIEYLTEHIAAGTSELAEFLGLKTSRTRDYLAELIREEVVIAEGENRGRIYKLKA